MGSVDRLTDHREDLALDGRSIGAEVVEDLGGEGRELGEEERSDGEHVRAEAHRVDSSQEDLHGRGVGDDLHAVVRAELRWAELLEDLVDVDDRIEPRADTDQEEKEFVRVRRDGRSE